MDFFFLVSLISLIVLNIFLSRRDLLLQFINLAVIAAIFFYLLVIRIGDHFEIYRYWYYFFIPTILTIYLLAIKQKHIFAMLTAIFSSLVLSFAILDIAEIDSFSLSDSTQLILKIVVFILPAVVLIIYGISKWKGLQHESLTVFPAKPISHSLISLTTYLILPAILAQLIFLREKGKDFPEIAILQILALGGYYIAYIILFYLKRLVLKLGSIAGKPDWGILFIGIVAFSLIILLYFMVQ